MKSFLPLRYSLPGLLGVLGLTLVLLGVFDRIRRSELLIESEALTQLAGLGGYAAERLEELYAKDARGIRAVLSRAVADPGWRLAAIVDSRGIVVESSDVALVGQRLRTIAPSLTDTAWREVVTTRSPVQLVSEDRSGLFGIFPFALPAVSAEQRPRSVAILYLYRDLSEAKRLNRAWHVKRAGAMFAVVALGMTLVWSYFYWMATKRLQRLGQTLQRVVQGNLSEPSGVSGGDEIGQLGEGLDRMLVEIRQRRRALLGSQRRMTAIIESAMDAVICTDAQQRITVFNRAAEVMFGRIAADMQGQALDALLPERYREAHREYVQKFVQSGVSKRAMGTPGTIVGLRADGEEFPIEASISRVHANDETILTVILRDISERKRFEMQREHLEAQLLQSQKMQSLGTLTGGIAHDFNNILTAIVGNARLAIVDLPPEHAVQRSLAEIEKAGKRAVDLVRQILTFARRQEAHREPMNVARVFDEALSFLRPMIPANILIRRDLPESLPNITADVTQMHQIVMNLGLNAAHAIGERQGIIDVVADVAELRDIESDDLELRPGKYLRVRFRDSGRGIDAAILNRIFDPFFTTKNFGQGTGLGLSVVHGIVKSHDGAIAVESELGRGACFTLYFPATPATNIAEAAPDTRAATGGGQTILYVDDEEALVFLLTRLLERLGYRVFGFTDPNAALDELRARPERIDALVSDLAMPGLSGFELAKRALAARADLPVILVSGYIQPQDNELAVQLGVRRLILKPNTIDELARALHEVLEERKSGRS